jgi:capsular polysaccharide export protein
MSAQVLPLLNPKQQVSQNPAFSTLLGATSVLLLQGPLGPFYDRLTQWLQARGKTVNRVVFQAGGLHDCRAVEPLPFRGSPDQWPEHLRGLLARLRIDCLVLFGQSRLYHRLAREVCSQAGVPVVVLEEGYFRPGYMTMELDGVNGFSQTLKRYHWVPPQHMPQGLQPDIAPWHFQYTAWHATFHYLAMRSGSEDFPHYIHHRWVNPYFYAAYWLKSWAIKLARYAPDMAFQRRLFTGRQPYFLVPLQHDGDAQITHHSPYGENTDFILQVMRSFAEHAQDDHWLVFRQHPHSRGGPGHDRLIFSLAKELGLQKRVHYMVEGDTPDLAQHARGVVLINSTVGFQALERGAPVAVLGQALYNQHGLVHTGNLDAFWSIPFKAPEQRVLEFLVQAKNLTQMPCSLYAGRNEPLAWDDLARLGKG